jgi:hydrogenase-4 component B
LALDLFGGAAALWMIGVILAASRLTPAFTRLLLIFGGACAIAACVVALPNGVAASASPLQLAGQQVTFALSADALWLLGFGLVPAALACWLGPPARAQQPTWLLGASLSLLGALGVFGLQDGVSFLIAWELMSLGGAVMILGERLSSRPGRSVLFMLALLEVGAVALLLAVLLLDATVGGIGFAHFAGGAAQLSGPWQLLLGVLFLIGFGAKLGLLPFYEWFPGAYGAASGASGALLSGVVLNAAFFGLSRGLVNWLPTVGSEWLFTLGALVIVVGVLSAILAILYAFQQEDWRDLLAFSTAENAGIAVTMLGVCLLFRQEGLHNLAGLAWTVALLHLAGHALAKGGLFLAADTVYSARGNYAIAQSGLLRHSPWALGAGAVFAAMSLAALPPQAGFVSEWFVFQTVFQGFHMESLAGRLTLALAGAGLALTAAVALATFVKIFGLGLLGDGHQPDSTTPSRTSAVAVLILGLGVLLLAIGMPMWLGALDTAGVALFGVHSAQAMHDGWLLVPLTAKFAFISPSMLIIAMPLFALLPFGLLLAARRHRVRRAPVWYGGLREDPRRTATTALAFSNALRTFYSFVYRPTADVAHEHLGLAYFVRRLAFTHEVAPLFGPYLFAPVTRFVWTIAGKLRALQSGNLNFYLGLIGVLLVAILALTLF